MTGASIETKEAVRDLINLEATYLDRRMWEAWLALYTEDAVYWAPAWIDEETVVDDPETSLNMMYLKGREALSDRIFRINTRDTLASVPLDRTVHLVDTIMVGRAEKGLIEATANWLVHSYGHGGTFCRGGFYDFTLTGPLNDLRIARKKITMIDDRLEGPVDFYHL